jgi:hypothetical protein
VIKGHQVNTSLGIKDNAIRQAVLRVSKQNVTTVFEGYVAGLLSGIKCCKINQNWAETG